MNRSTARKVDKSYTLGKYSNHFLRILIGVLGAYPHKVMFHIKHRSIEINGVITMLNDNAKFGTWIINELKVKFSY
jgi:hypothetical protein